MHSTDNHRHCFILKGSTSEVLSDFLKLAQQLEHPLICAHDVSQYQALADHCPAPFDTCSFKQARQQLGSSHQAILIDLSQGVSASTLAILAGTVHGNGLFAIALPEEGWLTMDDQDLPRYLPWPYESSQIDSSFKRYLFAKLLDKNTPFTVIDCHSGEDALQPLEALPIPSDTTLLTSEQSRAQSVLLALEAQSYVLLAPRGRGKSTLLGDSLAKLLQMGKKVALVAANQEAITTLKQRFESVLEASSATTSMPFFAPDALLANSDHWDIILVDEAATIPIPMLKNLHKKADHSVFSTTDYGYEGAGKGFGIRFCQYLETHISSALIPLERLHLTKAIRWGENDPLENWLNDCFFLASSDTASISVNHLADKPEYLTLQGAQWLGQETRLAQTFQLLLSAHYQTSADNLRWILDDPSVSSYLSMQDGGITSVAIVTEEGPLPEDLSRCVLEGTRRPRGHLIPQSLLAHEGWENAGDYRYWRISRIATQAEAQNKGLASQLVSHIEQLATQEAEQQGCDFLSTSFAATLDVVNFWLKNGFIPVRLGTTKDQSSGSYSLMMVKPLTPQAHQQTVRWHHGYLANLKINLPRDYSDIDVTLAEKLHTCCVPDIQDSHGELDILLRAKDRRDLALFAHHHRPYLTILAQLTRLIEPYIAQATAENTDPNLPLLQALIRQPSADMDLARFGLHSKKQREKHIRRVIGEWLNRDQSR